VSDPDVYVEDETSGDGWALLLGDACERLAELESGTVDFSIHSPPFSSLFVYSPSIRDLGNSADDDEFIAHYRFVIAHMFRLTKPGRLAAVHVAQVTSLRDFRGLVIRAWQDEGWLFHGEITVDKCPQQQAIRTHAQALLFAQLHRDSIMSRPALADYVLIFRKPGENATPVVPDVDNETWIEWAHPVWYGIRESDTLNVAVAREHADERHIAALQLPLIERCVRLWTNRGEHVVSPFAGIGSEGYVAVRLGRRFTGVELKESYYRTAVRNLRAIEAAPGLFDATPVDDVPPSEALG